VVYGAKSLERYTRGILLDGFRGINWRALEGVVGDKKFLSADAVIIQIHGAPQAKEDNEFKIDPCKVEKVASTAGAGDAWRGGFLAGLHRGFSLKVCGQMGCTASSFVVENFGTQEYFYSQNEFEVRYRQTYNGLLKL